MEEKEIIVDLNELNNDVELAEDIFSPGGMLLMKKGTVLNQELRKHLLSYGFQLIKIKSITVSQSKKSNFSSAEKVDLSEDADRNIFSKSSINIKGGAKEGINLVAKNDIIIEGAVNGSNVKSFGGDIIIKNGIKGKNKSIISTTKNLITKYIENTKVSTGGNIIVDDYISDCIINCIGDLAAKNPEMTNFAGGRAEIYGSMTVHNLGNENNEPTVLIFYDSEKDKLSKRLIDIEIEMDNLKKDISKLKKVVDIFKELKNNINYLTEEKKKEVAAYAKQFLVKKNKIEELRREYYDLQERYKKYSNEKHICLTVLNNIFPGVKIIIDNQVFSIKDKETKVMFYKKGKIIMQNITS